MAPKPTNVPSSPARKAKSVGQQPSGLPVPTAELLAAMAGSPSLLEGHDESPEKLSLKARLKLFEKEIEQQGSAAPAPKAEKKFSFLNPDEIAKMKEEEEKRIAQVPFIYYVITFGRGGGGGSKKSIFAYF